MGVPPAEFPVGRPARDLGRCRTRRLCGLESPAPSLGIFCSCATPDCYGRCARLHQPKFKVQSWTSRAEEFPKKHNPRVAEELFSQNNNRVIMTNTSVAASRALLKHGPTSAKGLFNYEIASHSRFSPDFNETPWAPSGGYRIDPGFPNPRLSCSSLCSGRASYSKIPTAAKGASKDSSFAATGGQGARERFIAFRLSSRSRTGGPRRDPNFKP
jgi:hypothetical protein